MADPSLAGWNVEAQVPREPLGPRGLESPSRTREEPVLVNGLETGSTAGWASGGPESEPTDEGAAGEEVRTLPLEGATRPGTLWRWRIH